jgi:hypothetical protein
MRRRTKVDIISADS